MARLLRRARLKHCGLSPPSPWAARHHEGPCRGLPRGRHGTRRTPVWPRDLGPAGSQDQPVAAATPPALTHLHAHPSPKHGALQTRPHDPGPEGSWPSKKPPRRLLTMVRGDQHWGWGGRHGTRPEGSARVRQAREGRGRGGSSLRRGLWGPERRETQGGRQGGAEAQGQGQRGGTWRQPGLWNPSLAT